MVLPEGTWPSVIAFIFVQILIFFLFFHSQNFREQSIDGEGLMMLTEEHLINILGMKLGPALKLRSKLVKQLNDPCNPNCAACNTNASLDDTLMESKSFINNFTKMSIPRAGSADSAKF